MDDRGRGASLDEDPIALLSLVLHMETRLMWSCVNECDVEIACGS